MTDEAACVEPMTGEEINNMLCFQGVRDGIGWPMVGRLVATVKAREAQLAKVRAELASIRSALAIEVRNRDEWSASKTNAEARMRAAIAEAERCDAESSRYHSETLDLQAQLQGMSAELASLPGCEQHLRHDGGCACCQANHWATVAMDLEQERAALAAQCAALAEEAGINPNDIPAAAAQLMAERDSAVAQVAVLAEVLTEAAEDADDIAGWYAADGDGPLAQRSQGLANDIRAALADLPAAASALLAELDDLRNDPDAGKGCGCRWINGQQTVTCKLHGDLLAERDGLRQLLAEYGRHGGGCRWWDVRSGPHGHLGCDCGLDAALATVIQTSNNG